MNHQDDDNDDTIETCLGDVNYFLKSMPRQRPANPTEMLSKCDIESIDQPIFLLYAMTSVGIKFQLNKSPSCARFCDNKIISGSHHADATAMRMMRRRRRNKKLSLTKCGTDVNPPNCLLIALGHKEIKSCREFLYREAFVSIDSSTASRKNRCAFAVNLCRCPTFLGCDSSFSPVRRHLHFAFIPSAQYFISINWN
jgi:hypothetical protein